jgi:hypothetical protein
METTSELPIGSTAKMAVLGRARDHNQLVTLQGRHFDVPPKIVGVGVLGRFPVEALVKTAIE